MQQLELFPELTTAEPYIGVEYTDGEDVYVSKDTTTECKGCAFKFEYHSSDPNCFKSSIAVDCTHHPIIWIKKTS